MPKCLTCYKWTLDEQDIKIKPEDLSLDSSRAKGKISDFDRNAIEEAALLVEKLGGAVEALTSTAPPPLNNRSRTRSPAVRKRPTGWPTRRPSRPTPP